MGLKFCLEAETSSIKPKLLTSPDQGSNSLTSLFFFAVLEMGLHQIEKGLRWFKEGNHDFGYDYVFQLLWFIVWVLCFDWIIVSFGNGEMEV